MQQVLANQWRPRQFEQVIGQDPIVQALTNALNQSHLHHAYLFTGTRGVGKTTIARILAKCMNCETGITATPCEQCAACQEITAGRFPDLYEIDAASRTKVEDTREILDNIQYTPTRGRFKVYLIDEVHMLSGHSFNALLKTLEEPPAHVKFLLATTDPQKLPATVLSRCLQFHLRPMSSHNIASHLTTILEQEKIGFEPPALDLVAHAAKGSMRDALSLLDQAIAFGNQQVNTTDIKTMLGTVDSDILLQLLQSLSAQQVDAMLATSEQIQTQGVDYQNVLAGLLERLHEIAILQFSTTRKTAQQPGSLADYAQQFSAEQVQLYYEIALLGQKEMSLAPTPQVGFEMTLLRMLAFTPNSGQSPIAAPAAASQAITAATTPAKPSPAANPKPSAAASPKPNTTPNSNGETALSGQWLDILNQIKLPGATNALAQACSLEKQENDCFYLCLQPSHQALLNDRHIARIKQALSDWHNRPINVTISVENSSTDSAATVKKNRHQAQLKQSEDLILQDENIKKIVSTFDATVLTDTITIEKKN